MKHLFNVPRNIKQAIISLENRQGPQLIYIHAGQYRMTPQIMKLLSV